MAAQTLALFAVLLSFYRLERADRGRFAAAAAAASAAAGAEEEKPRRMTLDGSRADAKGAKAL